MPDAVAIQGEAGSFSHAAALEIHGPVLRLVPCPTFVELFRAVETGEATRGIVPIENTLAGSVHENYDLLSAHALHVVAETELRRSEEHTSELQSRLHLVCRLLLEKKKKKKNRSTSFKI